MDESQCTDMLALVAQGIEAAKAVTVYKSQTSTFASRLLIFQTALSYYFQGKSRTDVDVTELTLITSAQDSIEKTLNSFINLCESDYSVDLWDWPDWELYFEKNSVISDALDQVIEFSTLLKLTLPLGLLSDREWQDKVDVQVDWQGALQATQAATKGDSHSSVAAFLRDHPPPRPSLRETQASSILTLFETDTAYAEESSDEEEAVDDQYASEDENEEDTEARKADEVEARKLKAMKYRGNFTSSVWVSTAGGAPAVLKKVGASYCRGGSGNDGVGHALLALAITSQHSQLPPSPLLQLPFSACLKGVGVTEEDRTNEIESLQGRRQREKDLATGTPAPHHSSHGFRGFKKDER